MMAKAGGRGKVGREVFSAAVDPAAFVGAVVPSPARSLAHTALAARWS